MRSILAGGDRQGDPRLARHQKPCEPHLPKQDQRQDSQLKELKGCCVLRRWKNPAIYAEHQSGASVTRPQLERLMGDVRAGKVERVVSFKLDRLGRSLSHLALLLKELIRHGVPLISTSQGIDTSSDNAAGKLQLGVLMAVAEFERSLIVERVNAGLRAAKERGVQLGRPSTINGRAAEIKKLKRSGLGLRAIARQLKMPLTSRRVPDLAASISPLLSTRLQWPGPWTDSGDSANAVVTRCQSSSQLISATKLIYPRNKAQYCGINSHRYPSAIRASSSGMFIREERP